MSDLIYAEIGINSPNAGSIGWVDFAGIQISPNGTTRSMEVTAKDGTVITFDLTCSTVTGTLTQVYYEGTKAPSFPGASFGNQGYRHQVERLIVMYNNMTMTGTARFVINNIQARDSKGNIVNEFSIIVADAETTNSNEKITWTTTGTAWTMLVNLPPSYGSSSTPQVTGLRTKTVVENGTAGGVAYAPVLLTTNPTSVTIDIATSGGKQGFALGFVVTSVTLLKDIMKRVNPADQFHMTITSSLSSEVVTTGANDGIQAEYAQVHLVAGDGFLINESLANNRLNGLSDYRKNVLAVNLAEGGSSPATGELPIQSTVAWGDMMQELRGCHGMVRIRSVN